MISQPTALILPPASPQGHGLAEMLTPLIEATHATEFLRYQPSPVFSRLGREYVVPHFVFDGPRAGGETVRLSLFAGIHGDEPEGAWTLAALLGELLDRPQLAAGYQLHVYPVCNPTGFAAGTRESAAGLDLNREFWRQSAEPEVRWLEQELLAQHPQGIISLHGDDTATGIYVYVRGAVFTETLARPMLAAAGRFLPLDTRATIDGFCNHQGLLHDCFTGVLAAPPAGLDPQPFELIFETPRECPAVLQVQAGVAGLLAVFASYFGFQSYQADI